VELVGAELEEGAALFERLGPEWTGFTAAVRRFLRHPDAEDTTELEANGRRISVQLASLGPELEGVVVALNDVTDVSRAERVLAWGEMARQVAHEIKNPLTPMRLGLQHLRRVYHDRGPDFDHTLEDTAGRMLAEIDRLDTIARAFSRFAAPAGEHEPLDRIDLAAVVGEVIQLYRLTEEGCTVRLTCRPDAFGAARADEVKEVVVNLLENARNAGARTVEVTVGPARIEVADDGSGIPTELLPRIFEPRFSTTTSGSGLGLAIVRRLVEGWGGRIDVESEMGRGTRVVVTLGGEGSEARPTLPS
jgi:signal transduction histidine kinase